MIEVHTMRKLAQQANAYADWLTMKRFCNQVYGEGKVARAEIETYGEYDDEGGTDYRLERIDAWDKDGDSLDFDLSLPFWKLPIFKDDYKDAERFSGSDRDDALDESQEALKKAYWPKYGSKAQPRPDNLVLWEDFVIDKDNDEKYDLLTPPDLPLLKQYGIL